MYGITTSCLQASSLHWQGCPACGLTMFSTSFGHSLKPLHLLATHALVCDAAIAESLSPDPGPGIGEPAPRGQGDERAFPSCRRRRSHERCPVVLVLTASWQPATSQKLDYMGIVSLHASTSDFSSSSLSPMSRAPMAVKLRQILHSPRRARLSCLSASDAR